MLNTHTFQNFVTSVLEEISDADEPDETNPAFNSEHDTESEQECDSDADCVETNEVVDNTESQRSFYGRNRFQWSSKEPVRNVRTPIHNIVVKLPGLKGRAKMLGDSCSPAQIWHVQRM